MNLIYCYAYKLRTDFYITGDLKEFIRRSSPLYRLKFMDLNEWIDWQEWVRERSN